MITITTENYEAEVKQAQTPVLLDFWAPWCGPCRAVGPVLDEIDAEGSGVVIGKVNVDEQGSIAEKFGIMSVPTFVLLKDGAVAGQMSGMRQKDEILEFIGAAIEY